MFSIIIPTYNERNNIALLIEKIDRVFALERQDYEMIVVDDDSPDNTFQYVQEVSQNNHHVRGIRREKERGLSSAVLRGFEEAKGEVMAVIDADHSHDEYLLSTMFALVKEGKADCVVGSRRVAGGGADRWPFYRKWLSNFATFVAHIFTGIQVKDPMSGYFCIDRRLYEKAKEYFRPKGYKILLEILVKARPKKYVELPYIFVDRKQGYSKLSVSVAVDYLKQIFELFWYRLCKTF